MRPGNSFKRWTDEQKNEVIQLYKNGISIKDIANRFERTELSIKYILYEKGLIDDEQLNTNKSIKKRRNIYGVNESQVLCFINDDNVPKETILNEREYLIIKMRYMPEKKMTLQEIGNLYGLSRERIRQIENKALRKIKSRYLNKI